MFEQEMSYPGGTRVLVWRLEEEAPQLLAMCREVGVTVDDLLELPVKRQREKAAEHLLLCRALGQPVVLTHDEKGAPCVEGLSTNISITHTPHLVAVAINEQQVIGLDAEQTDRRQVLRVRDKFLNDREKQFILVDNLDAHIIAWTAKEAIIKAERNSALDWTGGITLEPFAVTDSQHREISFTAHCGHIRYCLVSRLVGDHYMTLAVACEL